MTIVSLRAAVRGRNAAISHSSIGKRALLGVAAIAMTAMTHQTITAPTPADLERLDQQRSVVMRYLDADGLAKFATAPGKLGALRALLTAKVFKANQTYELQSMGVVLGDVFVQDMGFSWVMVSDEQGRNPAVRYRDTSVVLYPLTMISKRVERGEAVDMFDLYNWLADQAQKAIDREQAH
jgi:hypothetical protein